MMFLETKIRDVDLRYRSFFPVLGKRLFTLGVKKTKKKV